MTARELIKHLEACDLDKEVVIIISIIPSEDDDMAGIVAKDIGRIIENNLIVGIT